MGSHFEPNGSERRDGFRFSDIFKGGEYRRKSEELQRQVDRLSSMVTPEMLDAESAQKRIDELADQVEKLETTVSERRDQVADLNSQIKSKRDQIITFDDAILVQEFGLYEPRFDFANSSQFKDAIKQTREQEKELIRKFNASLKETNWTVNGKVSEGRKMVGDIGRLLMRAYNGECDEIIGKVKYTNIDKSIDAIKKSAESIGKFGRVLGIKIPPSYTKLKVKEAQLAFEYAQQKQIEKEAIREERERQREAAKLAKEIAEARKKLEKEKTQYTKAYNDIMQRLSSASETERFELERKADELKGKIADVETAVQDVDYREANQKAGYVYVISNIGSFGEGVYKIGMTRRLDPMERIDELSDASVPFNFDVHAMIFCDDAPALEAALHRAFEDRKVNLVNHRREFFRVSLHEIEDVVRKNYDKTVEFVETPDAEQYRASIRMAELG